MKIKVFGVVISVLFTALMVYILYICRGVVYFPLMICGGVTILATSFMGTGVKAAQARTSVLSGVTSWSFCAAFCLLNILFAIFNAGMPLIIIVNGLLLIAFAVIIRGLIRAKQ
ncbi:hypothetical protein LJC45_03965 [Alistipes sp. OttesenSCG-928-B03]|nr:hypothetical protein [Alistipes sp. OttesenSCG-928-B03]